LRLQKILDKSNPNDNTNSLSSSTKSKDHVLLATTIHSPESYKSTKAKKLKEAGIQLLKLASPVHVFGFPDKINSNLRDENVRMLPALCFGCRF